MNWREFKKAGHWPTLLCAFLYFDISFLVWCVLGPLGNFIGEDLHLSPAEKGFLVATPLLGAAVFRILWGGMADYFGPKRAGLIGIALTFVPLLAAWQFADSLPKMMFVAVCLGVPGASFAVALPMASQWYPPRYQGLALGIAGAGNSGTVLAALFLPRLAEAFGWRNAMALAAIPLAIAGALFLIFAKDSPTRPAPKRLPDYLAVLRQLDSFWFCFLYSITFGGFVGLASFLSIFFYEQYGVSKVSAGDLTALCVFAGSFMRPVGGTLADKFGGLRILPAIYGLVAVLLICIAQLPPVAVSTVLFFVVLAILGAGNGAVFQLVPQRFREHMGLMTGLIGAAGGVGGFFLPSLFGMLKKATGTYTSGLLVFAVVCVWALTLVIALLPGWRLTWAMPAKQSQTVS